MNERISQLLDGELGEFERHRALRELDGNGELRGTWERYHLIGAALRKELSAAGHCRIADRVAARLHGESAGGSAFAPAGGIRQTARWIGGLAIAASVATVAILDWGPAAPTASAPSQTASVAPATAPPVKPVAVASNSGTAATTMATTDRTIPDEQRARTDLGPYLVQHSEAAAATGAWRPYVRVISYPSDQ